MMKKSTLSVLMSLVIGLSSLATAHAASLVWGESSGTVSGYKVYYGTKADTPSSSVTVGNVTDYSLDNLPLSEKTQYYFKVTAYNAAGESPPSNTVAYTQQDATPPAPPTGLISK